MGMIRTAKGFIKFFSPPLLARPDGHHTDLTDIGAVERSVAGTSCATLATFTIGANAMVCMPFISPNRKKTVTELAFEVTTPAAAGGLAQIHLAENTDADAVFTQTSRMSPARILASSGSLAVDTVGLKTAAISVALKPGRLYWICLHTDMSTTIRGRAAYASLPMGALSSSGNQMHYVGRTNVLFGSYTTFIPVMTTYSVSGGNGPHYRYTLT